MPYSLFYNHFHEIAERETRTVTVWEKREFYAKWMGDDDPIIIRDLIGPALNLVSPQTKFASALLDLFRNVLLKDAAYVDRIKRHYAMFRQKIDNQVNPACLRKKKRRKA